jgi:hypothetical protein
MLRELPPKQQPEGEPIRRWFFSHEQDLVVWLDGDAQIRGFQLCYDKHKSEHAITWQREKGFEHSVVDDGESGGLDFQTPFLYPNGCCDIDRVLARFSKLSAAVPTDIVVFVIERLKEYPAESSANAGVRDV